MSIEYTDFGWANGWKEQPLEVTMCKAKKHKTFKTSYGQPFRQFHNEVRCEICKIIYHYDSS